MTRHTFSCTAMSTRDRHHDREGEGRPELGGEDGGLGDEARPDRAGRHQEHCARESAAPGSAG
ncbi:hypothetical protein [Nocardioides sp. B-3]|uniref:hypothetical protein n=1 Tax=Nocardioides sp. B-3 TaxID=2895565 RepID=UPI0021522A85|nr:hypothetical protein [Nocardioides sp. B-3]UUZ58556.1 hypothetical protein LP418_20715 [Nocardioides sp. B-3]